MREIIVDTGPLVALLNARDEHHAWARATMQTLQPPMLTCEAVLTEAAFLVRKLRGGPEAILDLVARGVLSIDLRVDQELLALRTLVVRYASVPMSLADACLVRMAEMRPKATILTLDSDFKLYRRSGRLALSVLTPERA